MARFRIPEHDLLHAEELLRAGAMLKDAAATIGCNPDVLSIKLRARGVTIPRRSGHNRLTLPADFILAAHEAGMSVKQIADALGGTRAPIVKLLRAHGRHIRNGTEANLIRFASASAATLREVTRAARAKRMGNLAVHAAAGGAAAIGEGEREVFSALQSAGHNPVQQLLVDGYAIDVACGQVAVEVKFSALNRLCERRERMEKLCKRGFAMVYIVLCNGWRNIADKLFAALDFTCRNPPAPGQYRVIRGDRKNNPAGVYVCDYPVIRGAHDAAGVAV